MNIILINKIDLMEATKHEWNEFNNFSYFEGWLSMRVPVCVLYDWLRCMSVGACPAMT